MKSIKKIIWFISIACFILILGYYRDFVFKSVNALIQSYELNKVYSTPPSLSFFENFDYYALIKIKWILTLLFSLFYLAVSIISIKILFENNNYLRITIGVYIALALVSAIFMTTGYFFPGISHNMYSFSRYLMGMAQSPIVLMILIPAFKISEKESSKITN
jgi:hypothetical protein